jgi:putative membrane protein (TIGR04086 family)
MALIAPAIAALLASVSGSADDVAPAVPMILGLFGSYLIGGYVAGRMAGDRTSWHGMMTAFFGLFVFLALIVVGYAAQQGILPLQPLTELVPGVRDLDLYAFGNALTFGALLGFLGSIFAGWLGGLLAPSHAPRVATSAPTREWHRRRLA